MPRRCLSIVLSIALTLCCMGALAHPAPVYAGDAADTLQARAQSEQASHDDEFVPPPPPTGVEARALTTHSELNVIAGLSLDEAMRLLARRTQPPDTGEQAEPPSANAIALAQDHLTRGRAAYEEDRTLIAATELERARALDATNPETLELLAEVYRRIGNRQRERARLEELLSLKFDDPDAIFTIALAAASDRDFERAAGLLAKAHAQQITFDHDPAATHIADFVLYTSLRELGYDQAMITVGQRVLDAPLSVKGESRYAGQLASVHRQRGQIERELGDALVRLGDFDRAMEHYDAAEELPLADATSLLPREVYAELCAGRPINAQHVLFESIRQQADQSISDQQLRLCEYLQQHVTDITPLADALEELLTEQPDIEQLEWAVALLHPADEAIGILRRTVARDGDETPAVRDLLRWWAPLNLEGALKLTITLAKEHPDRAVVFVTTLITSAPRPDLLVPMAEQLPASPQRELLRIRLWKYFNATGRAWTVAREAVKKYPNNAAIGVSLISVAAQLRESVLVEEAAELTVKVPAHHRLPALARASAAVNMRERAEAAADDLLNLDTEDPASALAIAQALRDVSGTIGDGNMAAFGLMTAETVWQTQPDNDDAARLVIAYLSPGSPAADADLLRDFVRQLEAEDPDNPVLRRYRAQQLEERGRFEDAAEQLVLAWQRDPTDTPVLDELIRIWRHNDRAELAIDWLDQQLQQRPGDPRLLYHWAVLLAQQGFADHAIQRLKSLREEQPHNLALRSILEGLYEMNGQPDQSLALMAERLAEEPMTPRRELEIAVTHLEADEFDEAIARLEWIVAQGDRARPVLTDAMLVAASITTEQDDGSAVSIALALAEMHQTLEVPIALETIVRGIKLAVPAQWSDEQLGKLIELASEHSTVRDATSDIAARSWVEAAQQLVDLEKAGLAADLLAARLQREPHFAEDMTLGLLIVLLTAEGEAGEPAPRTLGWVERAIEEQRLFGAPQQAADFLYDIAFVAGQGGDRTAMDAVLEYVIDADPNHAMSRNDLGYSRIERGHDDARTVELIERSYTLNPSEPNIQDTVGWLYYRQGEFDKARPLIEQSLAGAGQPSPEVIDHLGDVLYRLGETDEAVDHWDRAARLLAQNRSRTEAILAERQRNMGLVVEDPSAIYDRLYGHRLESCRDKSEAVREGREPRVTPTFAELKNSSNIER